MTTEPNNENLQRAISDSLAPADMSDADIERLLSDVNVKPISDATVARILKQVNPAHPSDQTVRLPRGLHEPGDRPGSSKEIVMSLSNPQRPRTPGNINRGSVAALVVSAMCLLVVLIVTAQPRLPGDAEDGSKTLARTINDVLDNNAIVPQVASAVKHATKVAVGDIIQTQPRERRRFSLPDGSVLFMNESTVATVEGLRRLKVTSGEVFVEVCPKFDDKNKRESFFVDTPDREVTAIGTKFAVRAAPDNTDVLVTQGKVKIDGVDDVVSAGRFVRFNKSDVQTAMAPRASEVLGWTEDLMVAAPIVPRSEYCGGALISVDPNGQETRLGMRKYHVDVYIEDGFARTTIDQTYFNHTHSRLEGKFKFPLPADASLSRLAMYVGPKLMEGGMAERNHARAVFEKIVHRQKDPALLEWIDGTTFSMRVFPLEPRQEKRLLISYTQRLNTAYGKTHYRFPAGHNLDVVRDWSATVRVKGGEQLVWKSPSHLMEAKKSNGDLILTSALKNALFDRDVVLEIQDDWGEPTEPSQPIEPKALASGLRAKEDSSQSKRGGSVTSERDRATKVVSGDESDPAPGPEASAYGSLGATGYKLTRTVHEDHQYLMLRHRPELKVKTKKQDRNWVFLFETSGDRNPVLARAQIEIVRTLLSNAEHEDTFNIVTAGTRPKTFRESGVACEETNIAAAIAWLEKSHLIGALDFEQGLKAGVALLEPKALASGLEAKSRSSQSEHVGSVRSEGDRATKVVSGDANTRAPGPEASAYGSGGDTIVTPAGLSVGRAQLLVHVGSALPVLGQTSEKELVEVIPQSVRYVGVGVGKRWSRKFMTMAASRTGGYFTQINPDEKVNWRAFELLSALNAPRLLDVNVIDDAEKLAFLTYTESIAHGDEICAIARMSKDEPLPKSLIVAGDLVGKAWSESVPVQDVTDKADYLPRSWARLEIDRLIADGAAKHRDEITTLSKAMYVMSPFTSLLVLENEAMYAQHNIDRGRKDHWALYPAPETIKVVHEPVQRGLAKKKSKQTNVLDTVLSRHKNPVFGTYYDDLVRKYNSHMDAGRFAEALVTAKQARELQPDSPVNLVRVEKSKFARQIEFNNQRREGRAEEILASLNNVEASLTPPDNEILYPKNWSDLVRERRSSRATFELNLNEYVMDADVDFDGIADAVWINVPSVEPNYISLYSMDMSELPELFKPELRWLYRRPPEGRFDFDTFTKIDFFDSELLRDFDASLQTTTTWGRADDADTLFDPVDRVRPTRDDFSRTVVGLQSPDNLADQFGLDADFILPQLGQSMGRGRSIRQLSEGLKTKRKRIATRGLESKLALGSESVPEEVIRLRRQVDDLVRFRSDAFAGESLLEQARTVTTRNDMPADPKMIARLREIILANGLDPEQRVQLWEEVPVLSGTSDQAPIFAVDPPSRLWTDLSANTSGFDITPDAYQSSSFRPGLNYFYGQAGGGRGVHYVAPPTEVEFGIQTVPGVRLDYQLPSFQYVQPNQKFANQLSGWPSIHIEQPVDSRFLSDLIAHAPGLNSTQADLLAVVESEGQHEPKRGKVDDDAKKLIDKARGLDWETVTIGRGNDTVQVHVNGEGQFAWERVVSEGLGEQVLCDGEHLWHLYDEIGLGAKRDFSRFHRSMISNVAPWLVGPVEELSVGANVIWVDDRTVAIVPLGQKPNVNATGKALVADEPKALASGLRASDRTSKNQHGGSAAFKRETAANDESGIENGKALRPEASANGSRGVRVELEFATNGRLVERRVVRVLDDESETLVRISFSAEGVITVFDGTGERVSKVERPRIQQSKPFGGLVATSAKETVAARKDLVILPLPYRDASTIFARVGPDAEKQRSGDGDYSTWAEEDALALLAADSITNNRDRIAQVVMSAFFKKGDTRAGLYVLIAGANPMRTVKAAADGQPAVQKPILNYQPNDKVSKAHKALVRFVRHLATASTDNEFDASELLLNEPTALAAGLGAGDGSSEKEPVGSERSGGGTAAGVGSGIDNGRASRPEASAYGSPGVASAFGSPAMAGAHHSGRFLYNICRARNAYYRWKNFGSNKSDEGLSNAQRQSIVDETVEVVGSPRSPSIGWAILRTMQPKLDHPDFHAKFAEAAKRFENVPHLAWFVRQERARTLFKAKQGDEAAKLYAELLTETLKAGFNPGIDKELREQFIKHRGQRNWTEMCRQTSEELLKADLLRTAIKLSMQLRELGDIDMANTIFEKTVEKLEPKERPDVAVLAISQYRQLKQNDAADKVLSGILENPWLATSAKLWRYGAALAKERGKTAEALRRLERAMTIEYILRPDVIDLQETRTKYTALLMEYEKIVDASATLEQEPPKDLIARIIRAADQWRSMEDDETQVCQLTSHVLTKLGKTELAWDYATTPLGTQPGSDSWRSLGRHLGQQKLIDKANNAYARAFDFEQTNPEILYEHANLLKSNGRKTDATRLFKQIAEGDWQPRFSSVKANAQSQLQPLPPGDPRDSP